MNKHALIIGASGVIGSNLATHLLAQGWQVTGVSRGRTPVPAGCAALSLDANAAIVRVRPALAAGPARVSADAASDYLVVINEVSTVETGRTSVRARRFSLESNR